MKQADFQHWLGERNRILTELDAMTNDEALASWPADLQRPSDTQFGALAAYHKARLMWTGASDHMKESSRQWLVAHGYKPTFFGMPA